MKKKILKLLSVLLCCLFCTIVVFVCLVIKQDSQYYSSSFSPTNTAVWIGDVDFGCWYDILDVDSINHIVKIKVYHDYDDGVWNESYYYDRNRSIIPFTKENILNSIFEYDINTGVIILKSPSDSLKVYNEN